MKKLIYIASPYSPTESTVKERDDYIREQNFKKITEIIARLMLKYHDEYVFFGPITYSHPISKLLPPETNTYEFWVEDQDFYMLAVCDEMWVIMMDGWTKSRGITGEINRAHDLNIPIMYLTVEDTL